MKDPAITRETLLIENERLKQQVRKLTRELTKELSDNVESRNLLEKKNRSLSDILNDRHELLRQDDGMENRYRLMAENIHEMISIMDIHGNYIYANQKAIDFHGKKIREVLGRSFFEVMGAEVADRFNQDILIPCLEKQEKVAAVTVFVRDGGSVHLECTAHPIFSDLGKMIGVLNVTRDFTESAMHRLHQELEQQINFVSAMPGELEDILKDIFLTLCRLNYVESGIIYLLNDEHRNLEAMVQFNIPEEHRKMIDRYLTESALIQRYAGVVSPRYDILGEQPAAIRNMAMRMGVLSVAMIPLAVGDNPLGYLFIASSDAHPFTSGRKITIESIAYRIAALIGMQRAQEELKETIKVLNNNIADIRIKQQMLIQKSKMESLGEMSAGVAHEINQPLMIISLSVENILQKLNTRSRRVSPSYLKKKTDTIQQNIVRISHIINNLRVFARDQSGILFERVDVEDVLDKTVELAHPQLRKHDIILERVQAGSRPCILGNPFKLEQAVINILSNSIYAVNEKSEGSPPSGYRKKISIRSSATGGVVHVDLEDNGSGIAEEIKEKLFTPFFTTKPEGGGTGLGLPIVYGIVREMNGEMEVTSRVGEYTCFRLTFPQV